MASLWRPHRTWRRPQDACFSLCLVYMTKCQPFPLIEATRAPESVNSVEATLPMVSFCLGYRARAVWAFELGAYSVNARLMP